MNKNIVKRVGMMATPLALAVTTVGAEGAITATGLIGDAAATFTSSLGSVLSTVAPAAIGIGLVYYGVKTGVRWLKGLAK